MIHEFENLPPITTEQANAIGALFSSCGSIAEAATFANMNLAEFVDCLSNENVRAHVAATRRLIDERARARIAEAAHTAAQALERVAEDPSSPAASSSHDPREGAFLLVERRRAASTLLRAYIRPLIPTRRNTGSRTDRDRIADPDDLATINALLAKLEGAGPPPKSRPLSPQHASALPTPRYPAARGSPTSPQTAEIPAPEPSAPSEVETAHSTPIIPTPRAAPSSTAHDARVPITISAPAKPRPP